jgi:hypothetical protein
MKSWQKLKGTDNVALVIGNGPSLSDVPVKFLKKYPSFGTNRIYLLDGFTPTYYAAVNPLVIEQFSDDINKMKCEKFVTAFYVPEFVKDAHPLNASVIPAFSRKPEEWVYEGYTVTFVCLQLAFYMGFKTVLLVGVDHSFEFEGHPNQQRVARGDDVNHFHPDYFGDGVSWHTPDLVQSERAYQMAKTVYDFEGRRIVNLTPGTKLDVFEKGDIAEW